MLREAAQGEEGRGCEWWGERMREGSFKVCSLSRGRAILSGHELWVWPFHL